MRDLGMVEDLTQSDVLADLGMTQAVKREAECRQVLLIADWAGLNDAEHFHPDTAVDGSERLVRLGGEGTPRVAEFAPAAVGLQLGVSPHTASMRMAEALDLRFRLPRCWQAVVEFRARADYARLLARKTRELPADQALAVDEQVVRYVDGRVGWSKFEQLIEVAIRRCDPEAARAREEAARERQFVKKTRPHDGMQGLFMWAEAPITAVVFARIRFFAQVLEDLGDPDPVDARMVKAMLLLAHPAQALKVLERHHRAKTHGGFDALAGARGSASDDGGDPVTPDDPNGPNGPDGPEGPDEPVLDYEKLLPTVLLFVHMYLDTTAEVSTGSTTQRTSSTDLSSCGCGGYSGIGNYGPMGQRNHRIKTFRKDELDVKQPWPGIYLWRDATGQIYLRDCTGTRTITLHRGPRVVWAQAA
jgi:hypothetical protein